MFNPGDLWAEKGRNSSVVGEKQGTEVWGVRTIEAFGGNKRITYF